MGTFSVSNVKEKILHNRQPMKEHFIWKKDIGWKELSFPFLLRLKQTRPIFFWYYIGIAFETLFNTDMYLSVLIYSLLTIFSHFISLS